MKPVLPESYRPFIVCPACKASLAFSDDKATCQQCGRTFSQTDGVWSFMLLNVPETVAHQWQHGQDEYEQWSRTAPDEYQTFLGEIESTREIYTEEYKLTGAVLDVGGHDGRLRHYLDDASRSRYLVVDPFREAILLVPKRANLVKAYPTLAEPLPFLQAAAEALPVADGVFDVVHMRSVLDHFADPGLALREAHRVLKPTGKLLVGVHVTGGKSSLTHAHGVRSVMSRTWKKLRDEGPGATLAAVGRNLTGRASKDEHMWHPTYDGLIELIGTNGFVVEREHWQKPPNDHVVYVMSRKA